MTQKGGKFKRFARATTEAEKETAVLHEKRRHPRKRYFEIKSKRQYEYQNPEIILIINWRWLIRFKAFAFLKTQWRSCNTESIRVLNRHSDGISDRYWSIMHELHNVTTSNAS